MGVGRAEFVRRYGTELGILASTGLIEGAVGDTYINRAYGVAFTKPSEWTFVGGRDTRKAQVRQFIEMGERALDLWDDFIGSLPVLSPYVTIADMKNGRWVPEATSPEVDHLATLAFIAFEGTSTEDSPDPALPFNLDLFVERDLDYFAKGYRRFELIQDPAPRNISGCAAVEYVARYRFAHRDLPFKVPTRERALYIFQNPAIQTVRMIDFPYSASPLTFDYTAFVESLCVL